MKEFKRYTDEQIEQANNADITEYVQSRFHCEKAGKEIHIRGYGGLYVNPNNNTFFRHSENIGGKGLLEFCKKILDMPFLEAMNECVGEAAEVKQFSPSLKPLETEKKDFVMPEKSEDGYKSIYAYFINTRSLSLETVREFANKGLIYPTVSKGISKTTGKPYQKTNAVFLHKNEQGLPCGADIQGIDKNPEYRFKGCAAHDNTDRGFVYDKGNIEKIDTVYIFEAPIDLMSFVELHPEIDNAKFVALSGLKPSVVEPYISSDLKVVSCVDNDAAGINFNNRILLRKMQESLDAGENLKNHTIENGEMPINYCSMNMNGKEMSFFLSKDDFFAAQKLGEKIPGSVLSWINRSNFIINRECKEAGVKDFNDLLKERKFCEKVQEINQWATDVAEKANDRIVEHSLRKCI